MPLQFVVLISRHGERERLVKHHTSLNEQDDPALRRSGLPTIAAVGHHLRAKYLDEATCGDSCVIEITGNDFVPHATRAESSGFARTLGTAETLLSSLFPAEARGLPPLPLPIYAHKNSEDALLRGYAQCPLLASGLEAWRATPAYRAKENSTLALRRALGRALVASGAAADATRTRTPSKPGEPVATRRTSRALASSDDDLASEHEVVHAVELDADHAVPLRDVWNAFDALVTAVGTNVTEASTLAGAASLSAWLEAHKFGRAVGGARACGGALLGEISRRLANPPPVNAADGSSSDATQQRLVYYSAHYPTMLCLLSALGISVDSEHPDEDSWLGTDVLPLSSVLAIELHAPMPPATDSTLRLRFLDPSRLDASNGTEDSWRTLRLPCPGGECAIPSQLPLLTSDGAAALPPHDASAWRAACGATPSPPACSVLPTPVELASLVMLCAVWLVMIAYCVRRVMTRASRHGGRTTQRDPPSMVAMSSTSAAAGSAAAGGARDAGGGGKRSSKNSSAALQEFTPTVVVTD